MVYVLNIDKKPLMPCTEAKARKLLKQNRAKIVKRNPFTIQLLFECEDKTQPVNLGIDAGSKHIGVSATTEKKVLYEADVILRNDIVNLLSSRREQRRTRRNRKTRYRKARFLNRVRSKHKGWLAPSIENKIGTHFRVVADVYKILPVTKLIVETAAFDTQLLRAKELGLPLPKGMNYQQGEQLYSWNVREYVLFRDNHTCRCCKGKSKDKILNTHHIESRKTGGDAPNNLVTLCETCHNKYHKGLIELPKDITRGNKYNDAAFMGIMRWTFYNRLKEMYDNVHMTFGYITKNTRIENNLPKEHYIDARCISCNPQAESDGTYYLCKKVRCHNRQIHKCTVGKGGYRKRNQADYIVKGFRLFDKVLFNNQECFIFGRRSSGSMDVRLLDGTKINAGVGYKKLKLLETKRTMLIERRKVVPPTAKAVGFPA